jgi:Cdc6-like AAA superfamily ATPase
MPRINKESEENYLEYVKENIIAREDELEYLKEIARQGAVDNKAGQALRNQYRESLTPDLDNPYVIRVDLNNGEIRYYGGVKLNKTSKKPIPESHQNVVQGLLILSSSSDGKGYIADYAENLPDMVARTRFDIREGKLFKIHEENISQSARSGGVIAEELVADNLQQTREKKMKTITSTLQPDQFRITREPSNHSLAIQGPPGSGKTAVLLERLARIAYADENVSKKGMLLIGPNRPFMEYVSQVLPALGETGITLRSIDELSEFSKQVNSEPIESLELLSLKGSEAMREILNFYIEKQSRILAKTSILKINDVTIEFSPVDSFLLIHSVKEENTRTFSQERKVIEARLKTLLVDRFEKVWLGLGREIRTIPGDPAQLISQESAFRTILRNMYPNIDPVGLLARLKGDAALFLELSEDRCEVTEALAWIKESENHATKITPSDVAILDFLDSLLNESPQTWGHIGIDEAQDLTPLEFTMVARRLDSRATVSLAGDLAQATGTFYYDSWETIMQELELEADYSQRELQISYRVPSDIIEYASRFLAYADVVVPPSQTFFQRKDSLNFKAIAENRLRLAESTVRAIEHLNQGESVLIIAPAGDRSEIAKHEFEKSNKAHVAVLDPREVKGLEFDHVIILNPTTIISELDWDTTRIARLFYVLTTRATKSLTLLGDDLETLKFPLLGLDDLNSDDLVDDFDEEFKSFSEVSQSRNSGVSEEIDDVDEYQNDLDALIEESNELFSDPEVLDFVDELSNQSDTSIIGLCAELGVTIHQASGDFLVGQWLFAGLGQIRCFDCREKPQLVFLKHPAKSLGGSIKDHIVAIVCQSCALVREHQALKFGPIEDVVAGLNVEKLLKTKCTQCGGSS